MDGWTVALILYLIPFMTSLVKHRDPNARDPHLWEAALWPLLMFVGSIILVLEKRK